MGNLFAFAVLLLGQDWTSIQDRAERLYAEGSYEMAHAAYLEAEKLELPPAARRRLAFRLADTDWRSAAASQNPDSTRVERAKAALEELQRAVQRPEERDLTWAESKESLGDFEWLRRDSQNLSAALPHYQAALDWWGGARDVEKARVRYLAIVFRMAWPGRGEDWSNSWWSGQIPAAVVHDAVRIARSDRDRAQAQYLLAFSARQRGADFDELRRGLEALESAIALGAETPWYDDALFLLAQWLEQQGAPFVQEDGTWSQKPDFVRAVAVYRRLLAEHAKGDTRWHDPAREAVERILKAEVGLSVPHAYLPGSEVAYAISWRNVERVDLALYPVDLTRAVELKNSGKAGQGDVSASQWLQTVDLGALEPSASWSHPTRDTREHRPGGAELRLERKLSPGAYVLEARGGGASARDIVLVTSSALVVKASSETALVWFVDALTSAPVGGADVAFFERWHDGNFWRWRRQDLVTAEDGTATAALSKHHARKELFVAARQGGRTAFSLGSSAYDRRLEEPWRIQAFTDRSTYRPGDQVEWKALARTRKDGAYDTPAGARLEYEIVDPKHVVVGKGELALNAFGSAWASFETNAALALGEYQIGFFDGKGNARRSVGSAVLFRLEEYKLPEFEVKVSTPEEGGRRKIFRLGDRIEASIEATYYHGASVAGADVEVLVHQRPFWRRWTPRRDFAWYFDESDSAGWRDFGGDQVILRQSLRTDAKGRATVSFESPRADGQDLEFTVEARVTDASRREIAGRGSVRVTRLAYAVNARALHNVHRPGDAVEIAFEAKDANGGPVQAEGRVKVERNRWVEVWLDAAGLERRDRGPLPGESGWRLKLRGYEAEEVATASLATGADGEALFSFPAPSDGYYTATWRSRDDRGGAIEAAAVAWVATGDTRELGYHAGGLEIVVDKDTFEAGQRAPVMICTPASGRFVLFTVEGETLHSFQVVKVEGTAKLVFLTISDQHVPNVHLSAFTTAEGDALMDVEEVIVPPVDRFLTVEVAPDQPDHLPGEEGSLEVVVKDRRGEPVSAEVALALVDESVFAIQAEYAADPRQHFFGEKRGHWIETQSSFQHKGYAKLVLDEKGVLRDERQALLRGGEGGGEQLEERLGWRQDGAAGVRRGRASKSALRAAGAAPGPVSESTEGDFFLGRGMDEAEPAGAEPAVQVRTDFRETALWEPALVTGNDGRASVKVKFPDSVTRWRATARVAAADARFGMGTGSARTRKPLMARLQAPRFFVVGDEATISGLIENRTSEALKVRPELVAEGLELLTPTPASVDVAAEGQARVDWKVRASVAGTAKLRLTARGGEHSDGMEKTYVVWPHGVDSMVARALKMKGSELVCALDVPAARRRETTRFTVQVAPSLAVTMLDALPYLVDYPYGCTEQTLSRFLPAAIVARTLKDRGLSPEEAMRRVFGGIEVETAAKTHPKGKRSLDELDRIVKAGLERLYDFQHGDGGWAWWKEGDSDHYMSAYVVWGLALARDAGVEVRAGVIERGVEYLKLEIVEEEESPDLAAWMLHALATARAGASDARLRTAFDNLWTKRDGLNACSRALFALAAHGMGKKSEAQTLARNLANGAQIDETPDISRVEPGAASRHAAASRTAHWGADRIWWRWSEGGVESTAFALRALLAIDPQSDLAEAACTWLVQNRRGAQWSNTRDTAIAVLALNDWLKTSGEIAREVEYELLVNGASVARRKVAPAEMLTAPAEWTIPAAKVKDGANEIRLVRLAGEGPLYLSARATFFSQEEPVPPRGHEVFAKRQYYKLVGRPTLLKGAVYERVPLEDGGSVASGERVEVVLTIEAKNDLEYLVFEDLKPAGLEAVQVQSGEACYVRELKSGEVEHRFGAPGHPGGSVPALIPDPDDAARYTSRQRSVHQELRDRKVALFLDKLPQGVWEVRYDLRAEVPGKFHALPVLGHAMYVPEIRCNGSEIRLTVTERGAQGE